MKYRISIIGLECGSPFLITEANISHRGRGSGFQRNRHAVFGNYASSLWWLASEIFYCSAFTALHCLLTDYLI